jgi:CDP-paratose 2-epimerase
MSEKEIQQLPSTVRRRTAERAVVITGGAGFIGTNLAHQLAALGRRVRLLDNLSRPGVEQNLRWLRQCHPDRVSIDIADVRDAAAVRRIVTGAGTVFHFAAQVAVTTSLDDPIADCDVNVRGSLNVLEAARAQDDPPAVLFTSTNKVYGGMADVTLRRRGRRYEPSNGALRARGFGEDRPLDFQSPYGCSKGAADQYVLDYARSFGLRTALFRMSCIYGPHQFGTEDQGWVAHFLIRALEEEPITLYGDGMQVRDILYVEDLVRAFLVDEKNISLLELLDLIASLHGRRPKVLYEDWRTGDQRYYVSDFSRFMAATGWRPLVNVREGISNLYNWLLEFRGLAEGAVAVGLSAS